MKLPLQVIAIAGGGGGVGRTTLSVELALSSARTSSPTVLVDGVLGKGGVSSALGLIPNHCIESVGNARTLSDVVLEYERLTVIPAGDEIDGPVDLMDVYGFVCALSPCDGLFRTLVLDCPAGLDEPTTTMIAVADKQVLMVRDDPVSINETVALARLLRTRHGVDRFHLVANRVRSEEEGQVLCDTVCRIGERLVDAFFVYGGSISDDPKFERSRRLQKPLSLLYPESATAGDVFVLSEAVLSGTSKPNGRLKIRGADYA